MSLIGLRGYNLCRTRAETHRKETFCYRVVAVSACTHLLHCNLRSQVDHIFTTISTEETDNDYLQKIAHRWHTVLTLVKKWPRFKYVYNLSRRMPAKKNTTADDVITVSICFSVIVRKKYQSCTCPLFVCCCFFCVFFFGGEGGGGGEKR